jgi:hypothetical protein
MAKTETINQSNVEPSTGRVRKFLALEYTRAKIRSNVLHVVLSALLLLMVQPPNHKTPLAGEPGH